MIPYPIYWKISKLPQKNQQYVILGQNNIGLARKGLLDTVKAIL